MREQIRILLADDHFAARASLAAILQHEDNMEVIGEASDGNAAVELAHELHPDIIIMDIGMPVMNGIEATRMITSHRPDARVIGFTMNYQANLVAAMQKAGAAACISKGDPIEVLLGAIRNCCPS